MWPLKALGNLFGASVKWNSAKHQVEIGMGSSQSGVSEQLSSSTSTGMNSDQTQSVLPKDVLVGAEASPPMGAGNGMLLLAQASGQNSVKIPLTEGANAFRIAIDGNMAYVPTLQGKRYVVNLLFHNVESVFNTP